MFPKNHQQEIYSEYPKYENPSAASGILLPAARKFYIQEQQFGQDLRSKLDSFNPRGYMSLAIVRNGVTPGLNGEFSLKVPAIDGKKKADGEKTDDGEKPVEEQPVEATIDAYTGDSTELIIRFPEDKKRNQVIEQAEGMKDNESLSARLRKVDAISDQSLRYSNLTRYLDPDEISLVSDMNQLTIKGARNAYFIANYFSHMAQLFITGNFNKADDFTMLSGYRRGKENVWLTEHEEQGRRKIPFTCAVKDLEERVDALQAYLAGDQWIQNSKFEKPLQLTRVVTILNRLGSAQRSSENYGQGASTAAIATEQFVDDICRALGRKDKDFVQKVRGIGEAFDVDLSPFVDVYTAEGVVTPSKVRNGDVHGGGLEEFKEYINIYDYWTIRYYEDLVKTIITTLAGKPVKYYDFDTWAREGGFIGPKKDYVAAVPIREHGN
jgi:hypothetical protein